MVYKYTITTVLLLLLFLVQNGFTQNAAINGYISDETDGETLISANITVEDTTLGATTNTAGYYSLRSIPPGTWIIKFSYLGYQSYIEEVDLEPGEQLRLNIDLVPTGVILEDFVVESERESEERQSIGRSRVSTELIKQVPAVLQADVFRSIQLLPGVKAASDFSSGLYIRGGSPDQTLIMLDRTTVYNPTHFFGFFSTFNPDAIKDVRLYKGGYPAEYGGRLGSVVDIYNKDGNRNETSGTLSLGMLSSRAMIEGPYSRGSYMIAARRSTLEPLLAALRSSYDNIPSSFYFFDINAKANLDLNVNNKLSLSAYAGQDDVELPFEDDLDINLKYGNRTVSTNWTHLFSNYVFSNFTFTGSQYFNYPYFEIGGTSIERRNFVYDFSAKGDIEWIPNNNNQIRAGVWMGSLKLKLNDWFDGQESFQTRNQTEYGTFYVQNTWRPSPLWIIDIGLRGNYFSNNNEFRLEPRFSIERYLTENTRLQASYGRYNQFLSLVSNEAFSGFDVWLMTDKNVSPAYGDQFILGFKNTSINNFNIEIEGYYRTMQDLFELNPFIADAAGLEYEDLLRFGSGYATGLELLLQKESGRFSGFFSYTFGITRRKYDDFNNNNYYPPKYDRTYDFNLVGNYLINENWSASAVLSYATGQAYTQPLGRAVLRDDPFSSNVVDAIVVGNLNASRLPAYHRLDLGVSRIGSFLGLADSELQFQVINVYSRRNIWFYNYRFDENPISRDDVNLLPILPTVTYTLNF
ncbi:MAG: TonB-dependent receptor [Balneolales bacterium]